MFARLPVCRLAFASKPAPCPPALTPLRHQVEYAIEAISHAGSAVGILSKDGVVLAAEKKILSKVRLAAPRRTSQRAVRHASLAAAAAAAVQR